MNMKPIISLILPAYNVEKYIETCVQSCEQQDLPKESYEIVIVNDGSTDDTPEIIRTLSVTYSNIKVVSQQNQGLSMARNNGFKEATGKYIWFIDSDDIIAINCLSTLVSVMEKFELDALTVAPSIPFRKEFPQSFNLLNDVSEVYNGLDFLLHSGKFVVGAWCYIFKRDFWVKNKFQFYPGITYEDTQLMAYAISKVSKVAALVNFSCYNYVQRDGSIMNSRPSRKKLLSQAVIVNTHLQYANETTNEELNNLFKRSASCAFIDGVKKIIQMRGDKGLIDEFLSSISCRPTYIYGSGTVQRLYQYLILNFPRTFIRIMKFKR